MSNTEVDGVEFDDGGAESKGAAKKRSRDPEVQKNQQVVERVREVRSAPVADSEPPTGPAPVRTPMDPRVAALQPQERSFLAELMISQWTASQAHQNIAPEMMVDRGIHFIRALNKLGLMGR